ASASIRMIGLSLTGDEEMADATWSSDLWTAFATGPSTACPYAARLYAFASRYAPPTKPGRDSAEILNPPTLSRASAVYTGCRFKPIATAAPDRTSTGSRTRYQYLTTAPTTGACGSGPAGG